MNHILVIDDNDGIRDVLKYFLLSHDYSVAVAESGSVGKKLMTEQMPDLVITDMMMPDEDGLELVMHMHRRFPDLPIIAISGGAGGFRYDPLPVAEKIGACRTFSKPLDLQGMLREIKVLLGEAAA